MPTREGALCGYPKADWSDMVNTTTTGSKVLLVGDFSNFFIADRIGMTAELIPHLFGATNRYPDKPARHLRLLANGVGRRGRERVPLLGSRVMTGKLVRATSSFITTVDGEEHFVRASEVLPATHPAVKAYPELFEAEIQVEQATAAPGEKRKRSTAKKT